MSEAWKVEMRYTVTATKDGKAVTYGFSNDDAGAQALLTAVKADPDYKSGKIIDNVSDAPAEAPEQPEA